MKLQHKRFEAAELKALGPDDGETEGTFEAVVAVFDNVDLHGDRIKSGAFDATLERWQASGKSIPVILEHNWSDPWFHIGYADPANVKSVPGRGLVMKGHLDIEDNPVARQVHRLMSRGQMTEFSFGYKVPKGGEKKAQDGAYDISEIDLIEAGPCLKGVNPDTELLSVKSALVEAGAVPRTKSYVDLQLQGSFEEAQDELREALSAIYPGDPATGTYVSVSVVATYADRVVYQVYTSSPDGQEDELYTAPYSVSGDEYTIGEASAQEVALVDKPEAPEPNEEPEPGEKAEQPEAPATEVEPEVKATTMQHDRIRLASLAQMAEDMGLESAAFNAGDPRSN